MTNIDKPQRELILHIGAHKTGTTSIQHALNSQQRNLLEAGWQFLTLDGVENLSQLIGFNSERGKLEYFLNPKAWKLLIDQCRENNCDCIMSSEDLFFLNDENSIETMARDLRSIFQSIKIVAYLRRQDSMAVSQKAQGAKSIQSALIFGSSPDPLPSITVDVEKYLQYAEKLQLWKKFFGPDSLIVRLYEKDALTGGDSVKDFASTLGLPLAPPPKQKNISLGPQPTLFLHSLRRHNIAHETIWCAFRTGLVLNQKGRMPRPARQQAISFFEHFSQSNTLLPEIVGESFTFNPDFSMYPEAPDSSALDPDFEKQNLKLILNWLRGLATDRHARMLSSIAAKFGAERPVKSQVLMELANYISTYISLKSNGRWNNEINADLLDELHYLSHITKHRFVMNIAGMGHLIEDADPRAAYKLADLALKFRPYHKAFAKIAESRRTRLPAYSYHRIRGQFSILITRVRTKAALARRKLSRYY